MKEKILFLCFSFCSLLFLVVPTVRAEDAVINLTDAPSEIEVKAIPSSVANAYPGMKWKSDTIVINNQSKKSSFQISIVNQDSFLRTDIFLGKVLFESQKGRKIYTLFEISKGLEVYLKQGETAQLTPYFELSGKNMDNGFQNTKKMNRFQFIIKSNDNQPNQDKHEEIHQEEEGINDAQRNQTKLPNLGENDEYTLVGVILLLVSFLLINLHFSKRDRKIDK